MTVYCPKCEGPNEATAKFCLQCGNDFVVDGPITSTGHDVKSLKDSIKSRDDLSMSEKFDLIAKIEDGANPIDLGIAASSVQAAEDAQQEAMKPKLSSESAKCFIISWQLLKRLSTSALRLVKSSLFFISYAALLNGILITNKVSPVNVILILFPFHFSFGHPQIYQSSHKKKPTNVGFDGHFIDLQSVSISIISISLLT